MTKGLQHMEVVHKGAIFFATSNPRKVAEFERVLGFGVRSVSLDLVEVQAIQVADVVRVKAEDAYRQVGEPVLIEDTGLYIRAWHDLPGALVTWFSKTVGNDGICRMMESWDDKGAVARTVIGYFDGKEHRSFEGEVAGKIADHPKGVGGFGWDPIFIPEGATKTFAEMSDSEKDQMSMRRLALDLLRTYLRTDVGSDRDSLPYQSLFNEW